MDTSQWRNVVPFNEKTHEAVNAIKKVQVKKYRYYKIILNWLLDV